MIKQITSVLIFVLLAGCGESKVTDTAKDIYGELKEHSPEYLEAVSGAYRTSLKMTSGHMAAAAQKWKERPVGICEMTDDEMFDFLGGAMAGTAFTGWVAGDSVVALVTSAGSAWVVMPAVATGLVAGAASATAAYGAVKTYCIGAPDSEASAVDQTKA
jgi:hypothetical protein